jgi:hypothetical protein
MAFAPDSGTKRFGLGMARTGFVFLVLVLLIATFLFLLPLLLAVSGLLFDWSLRGL